MQVINPAGSESINQILQDLETATNLQNSGA